MSQNANRECQICGEMYYACDNCTRSGKPRSVSCSPSCYSVYIALTEARLGIISKDVAIEYFDRLGINSDTIDDFNNLTESVRNQIKELISVPIVETINIDNKENTYQKKKTK